VQWAKLYFSQIVILSEHQRHNNRRFTAIIQVNLPSVLLRCWLGELQTCICPSWCHCHSLSLASVKSRLVLPFWYWLTQVVPEKGPLNGCAYRSTCTSQQLQLRTGGFCWCEVLLPACPFWWHPAHSDYGEDVVVLINSVINNVSLHGLQGGKQSPYNKQREHWGTYRFWCLAGKLGGTLCKWRPTL